MLARTFSLGIALAAAMTMAGCASRYDAQGDRIYIFQFGQDVSREVDYSNPRMPILPKWRPSMELWPVPSPWQFNDLSRYSMLDGGAPVWLSPTLAELRCPVTDLQSSSAMTPMVVGDNDACAACNESTARLALLALCADARGASPTL